MTLQRRLLVYLLLCAPIVWALALAISLDRARHEVDELFDTELIRLARQVHALLPADGDAGRVSFGALPPAPMEGAADGGAADVRDLAVAAWDRSGKRVVDHDGAALPYRAGHTGFVDETIDGKPWRVYYVTSESGAWLAAAGQRSYERDELVYDVTLGQLFPWMVMLPVLLLAMAWAVRRALAPMQDLAQQIGHRTADDLMPIETKDLPGELLPLLRAMNGLFVRVSEVLAHERRFTADAAHELRTPLAALRAQWDVVRRAMPGAARTQAEDRLAAGFERMERLVAQLLMLSRVEAVRPGTEALSREEVNWRAIVEEVVADCLPLAGRRWIEIECDWPRDDRRALPLLGHAPLLIVMLRNLLDNAVRYANSHSTVTLAFTETALTIENECPSLSKEQFARLGEPFHRVEGHSEPGSGLGISIARRIAALHGLEITLGPRDDGTGFRASAHFVSQREGSIP